MQADGRENEGTTMNYVSVFSTPMEPMATMAAELLRAEGIPARLSVLNRYLAYCGMSGFEELEVMVPESWAKEASEILAARFSETVEEDESEDEDENDDKDEDKSMDEGEDD
jgi:hypothetical protein